MCVNCISNAEFVAANVGLAAAVLKAPAHRFLADLGLVDAPDPVKRDVQTISFLRGLDLDPVEILGQDVVDRAAAWRPAPQSRRAWAAAFSARPIGSQSTLAAM
jgi:hypothetical protein